jgi:O-antigen/teichoic acid export membrane protein
LGIVQRQSIRNSVITYAGIVIGAISLILIQPRFLTKEEIGLTRLLFSFSTILGNVMSLGVTAAVIRYFPYFRDRDKNHHGFFGFMLIFPLIGFLFFGSILYFLKGYVIAKYANQSKLFTDYFYYLFPLSFFLTFTSVLTAYSYSLFRTSVPSLINEVLVRIVSIILFTVYFIKWIDRDQFIMLFVAIYGTQFIVMILYLFYEDRPSLRVNWQEYKVHTPKTMFIYGVILSLGGLAALGMRYLDIMVLGTYKPKEATLNALDIVGI